METPTSDCYYCVMLTCKPGNFFFLYHFPQGAALIRMLANFMGHSVFQMGLQVSKGISVFV